MPAVYVSDVNGAFGLTVDIVCDLQLGGHVPAVGGRRASGTRWRCSARRSRLRTRDLTPTVSPVMTDGAGDVAAERRRRRRSSRSSPTSCSRGCAAAARSASDAVYVGHSLGGLFGASTLFERPATFRRLRPRQPVDLVGRPTSSSGTRRPTQRPTPTSRRRSSSTGRRARDGRGPRARRRAACRRSPGRRSTAPVRDLVADAATFAGAPRRAVVPEPRRALPGARRTSTTRRSPPVAIVARPAGPVRRAGRRRPRAAPGQRGIGGSSNGGRPVTTSSASASPSTGAMVRPAAP